MITNVFGPPGSGKSLYVTARLSEHMRGEKAKSLINQCNKKLAEYNRSGYDFKEIAVPPVYSDFDLIVPVGGGKFNKSFDCDGFHLGFENESVEVVNVLPFSIIGLTEGQTYFNSRMSMFFPDWASRWYEAHRHFGLQIFIDCQRPKLIDPNIRDITGCFVEVESFRLVRNEKFGFIEGIEFSLRIFDHWRDVEYYLSNYDVHNYREEKQFFSGDIRSYYKSTNCEGLFIPETKFSCPTHELLGIDNKVDGEVYEYFSKKAPPKFYKQQGKTA